MILSSARRGTRSLANPGFTLLGTAFLLALFSAAPGLAMPEELFGHLSWRFVGPFRGGRVLAVSGVAGEPDLYYFGSVGGGVFRSPTAGSTWEPLFQDQEVASIGALAVAPSDPRVLYVGTGESAIRSDISYGAGVWRSDDGGTSWRHLGLTETRHIGALLIDPEDPDTVVVAALGHAFGPNPERGVFRTTDGGAHWRHPLFVDEDTGVIGLERDPDHPERLYATAWRARRPPWTQYEPVHGAGTALYRSDDGGASWRRLATEGLPLAEAGRLGVAVAPHTGGKRLYAVLDDSDQGGIYRSDDEGASWRLMDDQKRLWKRGWYFGHLYVAPDDPDLLYVLNTALYRSTDGGASFEAIKGSPDGDDYHVLWIDRLDPTRMILGADQGVAITVDRGAHWTVWYDQPTAQIYRMATDDAFPYHIYGSQQDSGSLEIPVRSEEGVLTLRSWVSSGGGESGYVIPAPDDPRIVYGSGFGGIVRRFDRMSRQSADISPRPLREFGEGPGPEGHYYPWTTPLAVSPFSGSTLYVGGRVVFRSTDRGDHWQRISPDLTGYDPRATCDAPPTRETAAACGYAVVYALAPSRAEQGLLWAGTTDGKVWVTSDDGDHWQEVTPPDLPSWSRIARLEPSPGDPAVAYLAVDRHRVDDLAPYLYRTRDGGAHWTPITDGIRDGAYVHVVRADSHRAGLLFTGTETGVYVSFVDGDHWQPLQLNLPTTSVRDLEVHGDDLIAATHGRGFWVIDGMTALREVEAGLAGEAVHLYAPSPAYRLRINTFTGEAMPPELPQASNPPTGAVIDYHLGPEAEGPVTLEIFDGRGRMVRRFASDDPWPQEPVAGFRPIWKAAPVRLSAAPGAHRLVWDLRETPPEAVERDYVGPTLIEGTRLGPLGPWVLPGRYEVVLTAGSDRHSRPLTVRIDPRVDADAAALQAQHAVGRLLSEAITRASRMIQEAEAAASEAGESARAGRIRAVLDRRDLRKAHDQLLRLLAATEAADVAPRDAVREAADRLRRRVEAAGKELRALLAEGGSGPKADR